MGIGKSSNKENSSKASQDFKATCQLSASSKLLNQDYINNYHQFKSLYLISDIERLGGIMLTIFDTEKEIEEVKKIDTPLGLQLNLRTCLAQLPNGELFCYGRDPVSGITLIIDKNDKIRILPSGTPCCWSSAIYFENCFYCFGGYNIYQGCIHLTRKFDLNENRWIDLAPTPKADYYCYSVVFNKNILISRLARKNLWLYSMELNSFSTIPYDFILQGKKLIINAERLYLIEWISYAINPGFIYESEDEYNWKIISKSILNPGCIQTYCLYNKGKIYIFSWEREPKCYQFNLKGENWV